MLRRLMTSIAVVLLAVAHIDGQGGRTYRAARQGANYMHNYYFAPAPSSTPWAPAWSPEGSSIAVAMSGSIWTIDPATGKARELTYNRPRAERREDPTLFEDLEVSFENGRDTVRWVALFEEHRSGRRAAHRDLLAELIQVHVDDKAKRTHCSNRFMLLGSHAPSPPVSMEQRERS